MGKSYFIRATSYSELQSLHELEKGSALQQTMYVVLNYLQYDSRTVQVGPAFLIVFFASRTSRTRSSS